MAEIHLYGELRRFVPDSRPTGDSVIHLDSLENETLEALLQRAGLDIDEIYTIFLNSKLLTTHNTMAQYLGYQQVCENCRNWDLSVVIKNDDRLGIFGIDMAALVV